MEHFFTLKGKLVNNKQREKVAEVYRWFFAAGVTLFFLSGTALGWIDSPEILLILIPQLILLWIFFVWRKSYLSNQNDESLGNMTEPITHDYSGIKRARGHDYDISRVMDGGKVINFAGWGSGIKAGDFILLDYGRVEGENTRYKINTISYYSDPSDMWKAEASFAPRVG